MIGFIPPCDEPTPLHSPDFVASARGALSGFDTRNGRNFCSEAGLFPQPTRDDVVPQMSKPVMEIEGVMLSWVITFLVIALIAGILGFGGVAGASIEIAKIIFFVAIVLFLVSAVVGLARGRTRV